MDTLGPDGRFVVELKGTGNVATIRKAVQVAAAEMGLHSRKSVVFPSVEGYATKRGAPSFTVHDMAFFDQPTELNGSVGKLSLWLKLFGDSLLAAVAALKDNLRTECVENGSWTANYRRFHLIARGANVSDS